MITAAVDIGQLIISTLLFLVVIIGYFIKKDIATFGKRIDKHDEILFSLVGSVQRLVGRSEVEWMERHK